MFLRRLQVKKKLQLLFSGLKVVVTQKEHLIRNKLLLILNTIGYGLDGKRMNDKGANLG